MKTLNELQLTDLEKSFINQLIKGLYAEPGFTDVEVKDMSLRMNVSVDSAKGVLGSLVKKGICETQVHEPSEMKFVGKKIKSVVVRYEFVILSKEHYHLHPIWAKY